MSIVLFEVRLIVCLFCSTVSTRLPPTLAARWMRLYHIAEFVVGRSCLRGMGGTEAGIFSIPRRYATWLVLYSRDRRCPLISTICPCGGTPFHAQKDIESYILRRRRSWFSTHRSYAYSGKPGHCPVSDNRHEETYVLLLLALLLQSCRDDESSIIADI